ncbi:polysaccharide deacetylase family protein [Plectosphaerella cucumerina]|jgi:peptidoglycan/xylan/chitin deacetylase (PgdA/CDA1 family)|uniref:Polysaccharide deacetylase family protein n=1 Tax=Plectosphaerella cucumerina TaxID=40658 RepID=A0A8K0T5E3_9PEZI|nr:polysaccharide deacetylase family protein [Plectosphaerella cucumerina]
MRFSLACALGALAVTSAAPLEERQNGSPVPPYVDQGVAIFSCTKPGTIALTFDDGIAGFTANALNQLRAGGHRATFFVNGDNFDQLRNNVPTLQRMFNEGHQVGHHTWNHPHLPQLGWDDVKAQMTRLEHEMIDLVGRYPTYMRPPYFEYNAETLAIMKGLKYRVIITDVDTNDWKFDTNASFNDFVAGLNRGGSIVLAHDVHDMTVNQLLPRMLSEMARRGLKSVPVGECLGEHPNNWYRYTKR